MSDINKEELNDAGQRQEKPIISEYFAIEAPSKEFITEQQKENKPIIMKGILQKADTVNRNGRVYPYEILKREADKYMKLVQENEAGGEQDHPETSIVSLANISHRVIDMWWEGKELHGKVLVAEETTAGKNIIGLLKAGFKLGISSRGLGSVKKINGQDVVQDDFELVAFDFVSSPSTPGAYLFRESNKMSAIKMEEENIHVFEDNLTDKYREVRKIFERKFWKF